MNNISFEIPDWHGTCKELKEKLNNYKLRLVKLIENNVNGNLQFTIKGKEEQVKKFLLDNGYVEELWFNFDENPYLEWSEDSISEELFELKQWIVEDWLDRTSTTNDDNYKKYHLLNNALEIVDQDEITVAKVVNLLNKEKINR